MASAESTFIAALLAAPAVAALVGTRVAENSADASWPLPFIVLSGKHQPLATLAGDDDEELVMVAVQCWAETAAAAAQLAQAVSAAVQAYTESQTAICATVTGEESTFDPEAGLDGRIVTVEWYQ